MDLPQELIEEILSHLPSDDRKSLRAFSSYSLISKSWLDPSRRILFADLSIELVTFNRFLTTISPTNTGLLRHVRSLSYCASWEEDQRLHQLGIHLFQFQDHISSMCQLRALTFSQMIINSTLPGRLGMFSAFQHVLSSLQLVRVSIAWSAFASLVGYFPNLRNLLISYTSFYMDDQPVPRPSHALRGKLSLWVGHPHVQEAGFLVGHFLELKPEYEEVALSGTLENQCRFLPVFQRTLKHLLVHRVETGMAFGITSETLDLSLCPELQEMHILDVFPQEQDLAPISSITSINLRKIILDFVPSDPMQKITWDPLLCVRWSHFDDELCELADRLRLSGHRHILEVEFRMERFGLGSEVEKPEFLPRFREKGRVRVVRVLVEESVGRADMR